MKKQKTNNRSTISKITARVMLVLLLLTSALGLFACTFAGQINYSWEVYSHNEFVKKIEEYNSKHDLYVDTFISFDLDNNDNVTRSLYYAFTMMSTNDRDFLVNNGYICDIHDDGLVQISIFYLKGDSENSNDYSYKIKVKRKAVEFNFTANEKMEFLSLECARLSDLDHDFDYEESLNDGLVDGITPFYNYTYHYILYANNAEIACFHISSIEEPSEEKLNEIIQMMLDSLVVINSEDDFVWREQE